MVRSTTHVIVPAAVSPSGVMIEERIGMVGAVAPCCYSTLSIKDWKTDSWTRICKCEKFECRVNPSLSNVLNLERNSDIGLADWVSQWTWLEDVEVRRT